MRRLALGPTLVFTFLSPTAASAMGLGDIELQSALNQRLDAEIALRGVPAGQGEDVIVALASEQAFRDVGLERPFSLTHLDFEVAARDDGSHYIQVTSSRPMSEPFLSFLLEVDGPDGNLLREYTVLLDPPVFARDAPEDGAADASGGGSAVAESPDPSGDTASAMAASSSVADAMTGAVDGGGEGDTATALSDGEAAESSEGPAATQTAAPGDTAEPGENAAERKEAVADAPDDEGVFGDTPVFLQIARQEEAAERRLSERSVPETPAGGADEAGTPEVASASGADDDDAAGGRQTAASEQPARADEYGEVQEGQTLWGIAAQVKRDDTTVQQMMLALLRYNPEAFEDGNINRLKQGYVLRVPAAAEVGSISAQLAIARVREQNGLWREWRDSLQGQGPTRVAADEGGRGADGDGGPGDTAEAPAAGTDSRLSIVGADEGGASSDESASAAASADGASEELKLAREELASARAEKQELADRVAALEGTVAKMEQLITLRENQLAQLQEQLSQLDAEAGSGEQVASAPDASVADGDGEAVADSGTGAAGAGDQAGGDPDGGTTTAANAGEGVDASDGGSTAAEAGGESTAEADGGAVAQTTAAGEPEVLTTRTQTPQKTWLDTVTGVTSGVGAAVAGTLAGLQLGPSSPLVLGGAGMLVLALGWLVLRRRRAAAIESELDELDAAEWGDAAGADLAAFDGGLDSLDGADDGGDAAAALDDDLDLGAFDSDIADASDERAEKDDTVAEADVYLAYGLHQQAEDLLRLALEETPARHDYHEKLLETLFAAGKSEDFVVAAEAFRDRLEDPEGHAWQRVAAMGGEIAPQHALFAGQETGRPAASRPAADDGDLGLGPGAGAGGGAGSTDSFAQALLDEAAGAEPLEGDTGLRGPGDSEPGGSASAGATIGGGGDDDLTFDLSDLGVGDDLLAETADETVAGGVAGDASGQDGGLDFDLSDVGLDTGDGGDGGSPVAGTPAASAASAAEGLDFDLGALEGGQPPETTASEGGMDFTAGSDGLDGGEDAFASSDIPGDGSADVGGGDPTIDFDLGDLERELDEAGAAPGPEAGAETGATSGADMDSGADEEDFATMLDLAKAYIDMGDAESASNALEEVIAAGSDEQRSEARTLLETVQ